MLVKGALELTTSLSSVPAKAVDHSALVAGYPKYLNGRVGSALVAAGSGGKWGCVACHGEPGTIAYAAAQPCQQPVATALQAGLRQQLQPTCCLPHHQGAVQVGVVQREEERLVRTVLRGGGVGGGQNLVPGGVPCLACMRRACCLMRGMHRCLGCHQAVAWQLASECCCSRRRHAAGLRTAWPAHQGCLRARACTHGAPERPGHLPPSKRERPPGPAPQNIHCWPAARGGT